MADQGMPTTYDTQATTQTTTSSGGTMLQLDYVRTIPGILKLVEIVASILTFICAVVWGPWYGYGGAWVQFVSMSAFILTLVIFLFYFLNVIGRLPGIRILGEFIYYAVYAVLFLIAAIVASARGHWHSSIGAAAFFAFCATAVFAVDTFFQYRAWRTGQTEMTTTTQTTTTTTTHSSSMEAGKAVY